MAGLPGDVLGTLLYFDLWAHPLTVVELYLFLPSDSLSFGDFERRLRALAAQGRVGEECGFYFPPGGGAPQVRRRLARQRHAEILWPRARKAAALIRRFPFVRGVFVSGDLSKNATDDGSDVDFFIITEPGRVWIARTLLILFKKVFLLNSRKYFCLNSFIAADHLRLDEQNIFCAIEIATLVPLVNPPLLEAYREANAWLYGYLPNMRGRFFPPRSAPGPRSRIQRALEGLLALLPCNRLDCFLQGRTKRHWKHRYPGYDTATHERVFRSTRGESRAHVGNFQERILRLYNARLRDHGLV